MAAASSLDLLLRNAVLWRGSERSRAIAPGVASGFAALDEKLGGWPIGAVVELILQYEGVGELSLLLPALARLSRDGRWIALVNPPYVPYAPALATAGVDIAKLVVVRAQTGQDASWAMEQSLRSGACGAVLGWPRCLTEQAIRRLQLAAEIGSALAVCFTACDAAARTSLSPYRLRVDAYAHGTRVEILKRRGGGVNAPVHLENVVALPGFSAPVAGSVSAGGHAA